MLSIILGGHLQQFLYSWNLNPFLSSVSENIKTDITEKYTKKSLITEILPINSEIVNSGSDAHQKNFCSI